jgi:hypothetical protein
VNRIVADGDGWLFFKPPRGATIKFGSMAVPVRWLLSRPPRVDPLRPYALSVHRTARSESV